MKLNRIHIIDKSTLVDKVEMSLIEFLDNQSMHVGTKIPKEVELALKMGVSRTVVREALNRLKTVGLIESIKHRGNVVKSPDFLNLIKKGMIPQIIDQKTLLDIFEMRLILEIGMADLIFLRMKPEDIDELYEIVDKEPERTDNIIFGLDHEKLFHSKLYQMTGNQYLMQFQTLLLPIVGYVYRKRILIGNFPAKHHVTHRQLVDTLKSGNPKSFRQKMRLHLENHFQRIHINNSIQINQKSK
ncbi:MAG TPA: FadR family transcriptional regulator [Bacteroidales bacterium]|nr:FadR family transcriptional regulator [Bacteroidales bacterium]